MQKSKYLLHTLKGHIDTVTSVVYSPDGQHITSASYDSTIKIWNSQTGQLLNTLTGHRSCVYSVAYSPNSEHIASTSFDNNEYTG